MTDERLQQIMSRAAALLDQSPGEVIAVVREVLRLQPEHREATQLLAEALRREGDPDWKEKAAVLSKALQSPELLNAAQLINAGKLDEAGRVLRSFDQANPKDPNTKRLMADLAMKLDRNKEAEELLRETLTIAPCYASARFDLGHLLHRENKLEEAIAEFDVLLDGIVRDPRVLTLKAGSLTRLGRVEEAAKVYEELLELDPEDGRSWVHYGHALRNLNRQSESVDAYRRAISINQSLGAAWWSLANLKTVTLTDEDVDQMLVALARDEVDLDSRIHLHFALGKATEDEGAYREAFAHYATGNGLRRPQIKYDADWVSKQVRVASRLCGRDFLAGRSDWGSPAEEAIFIVGMPRSGSTLLEQIISSHAEVEGLSELPYAPALARDLAASSGADYPECLGSLTSEQARAYGERYLELSRAHRRTGKRYFVDKNPNNWLFVDFIRLILPNARIIDMRRNPLGCGLANYKQHFAQGQGFAYSLELFGQYYRDYVSMIERFEQSGGTLLRRIHYEDLVERTEDVLRSLLAWLELAFDENCLRFYDNPRSVRTPSSEQVRQPINSEGVSRWKAFEPWLQPLQRALGTVLDAYPAVPTDLRVEERHDPAAKP